MCGAGQAGHIGAAIGPTREPQEDVGTPRRARSAVSRITARIISGRDLCPVASIPGGASDRVHLRHWQPLVVTLYGGVRRRARRPECAPALRGLLQQTARVTHSPQGRRMEFSAPLPPDLTAVLEDLPGWKTDE